MKIVALTIMTLTLLACTSVAGTEETTNCNGELGEGWALGYGSGVESPYNLDSDRCVEIHSVWCCAF